LTAIFFACLGQAEFINYLLFAGVALVVTIRFRKKIPLTTLPYIGMAFLIAIALSLGNYLLFDIRHEFLILKSVMGLINGASGYNTTLFESMKNALFLFVSQFAMIGGIYSWWVGAICLVISLFILGIERKRHEYIDIVLIWLFVPVLILMMLRHSVLEQLYVGLVPGMILAIAIAIEWIIRKASALGIIVGVSVIAVNIYACITYLPTNTYVFFQNPQPNVRYADQQEVVKRIFELANGKKFFFQSYTIPYFWQDAWTYLFWYEGTTANGYIPMDEETASVYVIIQKDRSDRLFQSNWYEKTVSTWGKRTEGFTIGEYTVERRDRER